MRNCLHGFLHRSFQRRVNVQFLGQQRIPATFLRCYGSTQFQTGSNNSSAPLFIVSPPNRFKSVHVNIKTNLERYDAQAFHRQLTDAVTSWKNQELRGAWITLPISAFHLVPICQKVGFQLHHCKDEYLTMSLWLCPGPSSLPRYTTHTVGVAGCVINEQTAEVLVIRDKSRPEFWKFPGGFSDLGEDIPDTAKREVFEETGVTSEFRSVLTFRQHHNMPSSFNMSDIYAVCRMNPLSLTIKPCPIEVLECRWRPVDELLKNQETTLLMRRILNLVRYGLLKGFENVDISAETFDSILPGKKYMLFHKSLPAERF